MITASLVKELREITGAGMMDCKKALTESNANLEEATDYLRKKGIASAAKKGGRTASDGLVGLKVSDNDAVILEVNSETDFVAKNEGFIKLAEEILDSTVSTTVSDIENFDVSGTNIKDKITESITVLGENIKLRRIRQLSNDNGFISSYVHAKTNDSLGKIAILISVSCDKKDAAAKDFARQIAMHVAAQKPVSLTQEEVPKELVDKEKEIFSAQAKESGKPDNIIEKMVEGRIRKFYEEIVLLDQAFVIDGKTKVRAAITEFNKENNCNFSINEFVRFEVGEGIEKKEDNFAEEAAAMAKA